MSRNIMEEMAGARIRELLRSEKRELTVPEIVDRIRISTDLAIRGLAFAEGLGWIESTEKGYIAGKS